MKINQKLFLTIKASLIVLAGLFGMSVRASEELSKLVVDHKIKKMPDSHDAWCRQQLEKYWSKDFIDVERRKDITPKTLRLFNVVRDEQHPEEAHFNHTTDSMAVRLHWPLWLTKFLNNIDSKESQCLAHEFVHLAKDGADCPIDEDLLRRIDYFVLVKNDFFYFNKLESSDDKGQSVAPVPSSKSLTVADQSDPLTHCEFFADLKGLELLKQGDSIAYQVFLRSCYKAYVTNQMGRSKEYPDAHEFLLCWALYKKAKENQQNSFGSHDITLHNVIDNYLKKRSLYKNVMASGGFLKKFKKERATFLPNLIGDSVVPTVLLTSLYGGVLGIGLACCLDNPALSLFGAITLSSTLIPVMRTISRLSLFTCAWDHNKFKKALDEDATRVECAIQRKIQNLADDLDLE